MAPASASHSPCGVSGPGRGADSGHADSPAPLRPQTRNPRTLDCGRPASSSQKAGNAQRRGSRRRRRPPKGRHLSHVNTPRVTRKWGSAPRAVLEAGRGWAACWEGPAPPPTRPRHLPAVSEAAAQPRAPPGRRLQHPSMKQLKKLETSLTPTHDSQRPKRQNRLCHLRSSLLCMRREDTSPLNNTPSGWRSFPGKGSHPCTRVAAQTPQQPAPRPHTLPTTVTETKPKLEGRRRGRGSPAD